MPRGTIRRLSFAYSRYSRQRKASFAVRFAQRHDVRSLLVVGASPRRNQVDGIVERALVESVQHVVVSGLEAHIEEWANYIQADALDLPFAEGEFDLVYSNAVIEHVGEEAEQRKFMHEHDRVGREWIATTPNRWFPIEAHTHQLFRHWSPSWVDERGSVTRLLTPKDLRDLLPRGRVIGTILSPTLTAISSRA